MKENYTLHYAPDNAAMIIRIALEMIGAPYDLELVNRRQSQQQSPKYLALNPLGMIQALQTHPAVKTVQQDEGLGPTPFTDPPYANPMIGSAT